MSLPSLANEFGRLQDLLEFQGGVATREQFDSTGISEAVVLANLSGRRWRALNEHVVVTHNGPLTRPQAMWAATDVVHLLVPRGGRPLGVPGVRIKVHESRRFPPPEELTRRNGLHITSLARAAVDAAVWSRDVRRAWRLVVAPVQSRQLRAEQIRVELEKAGKVRHRHTLQRLLLDLEGGAQALSEVEFLRFCQRNGFPTPKCQSRLDTQGRRRYLDAEFVSRSGRRVLVEIDGGIHLKLAIRAKDTIKDNDAHIAGQLVLRYASISIYTDDPDAVRQISLALAG